MQDPRCRRGQSHSRKDRFDELLGAGWVGLLSLESVMVLGAWELGVNFSGADFLVAFSRGAGDFLVCEMLKVHCLCFTIHSWVYVYWFEMDIYIYTYLQ